MHTSPNCARKLKILLVSPDISARFGAKATVCIDRLSRKCSILIAADETLATWTDAVKVENGLAVKRCVAQVLVTGVLQILNLVLFRQQGIGKADQQFFVRFLAEQFLETNISEQVDVICLA